MLLDKLQDDLKSSLKNHDELRLLVIRGLLSDINYAKIDKQHDLSDEEILEVFAKQAKKHRESIEMFKKGLRLDLCDKEEKELVIIQEYLPKQIGTVELEAQIKKIIDTLSNDDKVNFGKAMSAVMGQLKGKAEGGAISQTVKKLLSNNE